MMQKMKKIIFAPDIHDPQAPLITYCSLSSKYRRWIILPNQTRLEDPNN